MKENKLSINKDSTLIFRKFSNRNSLCLSIILCLFTFIFLAVNIPLTYAMNSFSVLGWGLSRFGQLGDRTSIIETTPVYININNVKDLAAGGLSSYALKEDGTVWAWGGGILGDGSVNTGEIIPVRNPFQVKDPGDTTGHLTKIIALSSTNSHTLALKDNGTVMAWGRNDNGQLGDGTTLHKGFPTQVKSGTSNNEILSDIIAISAGGNHSLALKEDGTVWAWGWNLKGELGDGTNSPKLTPIQVKDPNDTSGNLTNVIAIAAEGTHSIALKSDGTVWVWGELNSSTGQSTVIPTKVNSLVNIKSISAGVFHKVALKTDGTVWTWGWNRLGQLGSGSSLNSSSLVPSQVKDANGIILSEIIDISAEQETTFALDSNGKVWSWGRNDNGQLGNGTTVNQNFAKQIPDLNNVIKVTAGGNHALSLVTNSITPTPTVPPASGVLEVPFYSQNALPWGPSEYDHTVELGVSGIGGSMDRWGCAVTSVAMVLNYHNMTQFPDGTQIDPGSVNQWLKDNGGYSYGYGKDGWYSSIIWNKVSVLTQELKAAGKASYKLEWQRKYPSAATTTLLNNDLTEGNDLAKIPGILFVNNSGHFIVAKGILGDTYAINDPEWNYPTLTSFDNTYSQLDRFVPSNTDLSYIVAVVNPDVEILVTDSQDRKVGEIFKDGQSESYNEIPGASYQYDPPISSPNDLGIEEKLGTGANLLLLPKPEDGEYTVTLTGNTQTNYTLNISAFEDDGDSQASKSEGILEPNEENTFSINYSQIEPANILQDVDFQSVIDDVNDLHILGHIQHQSVANSLIRNIEQAEKAANAGDNGKVVQNMHQFINILNRERGRKINERGYSILLNAANSLNSQYTN